MEYRFVNHVGQSRHWINHCDGVDWGAMEWTGEQWKKLCGGREAILLTAEDLWAYII